jgi:uncharacterized membrane protein
MLPMTRIKEIALKNWDVYVSLLISLVLLISILISSISIIRLLLGLISIIFLPGYAFTSFLFPNRNSISRIERLSLSFGLSIALVSFLSLGLSYSSMGVTLESTVLGLDSIIVLFLTLTVLRRKSSRDPIIMANPFLIIQEQLIKYRNMKRFDRILGVIVIISLLMCATTLLFVIESNKYTVRSTEFYILGSDGLSDTYPTNISANTNVTIIIGIINHEQKITNYSVDVWLEKENDNNSNGVEGIFYIDTINVTLEDNFNNELSKWNSQWENNYNIDINKTGNYTLWFVLYKDNPTRYSQFPQKNSEFSLINMGSLLEDCKTGKKQSVCLHLNIK